MEKTPEYDCEFDLLCHLAKNNKKRRYNRATHSQIELITELAFKINDIKKERWRDVRLTFNQADQLIHAMLLKY